MATTDSSPRATTCDCGCHGLGPALSEFVKHLGPPGEARRHFDQARVEFLKGLRAVLDARIEEISRGSENRGTKVPVE